MSKRFPFYRQLDAMDCGATCLRMIAKYYGRYYPLEYLRDLTHLGREGVSLRGISDAAEQVGFHTLAAKVPYQRLTDDIPLPFIAHWRQNHFIVVYKVTRNQVWIADPASGKYKISKAEFVDGWSQNVEDEEPVGIVLLLEPTASFYEQEEEKMSKSGFRYLFSYFRRFPRLITQVVVGLVVGSVLQLIFPFLMQAIVDYGINKHDYNFIWLVVLAQIMLYLSQTAVELIRSWILLHVGARVNINLISDFLLKLMRLPMRFFDTKLTGDLLQRITDNERVEQFLTSTSLMTFFSFFTFVVFGIVLLIYDTNIFLLYLVGTLLYVLWAFLFWNRRRELDFKRFDQQTENQSQVIQLIEGIQDIKLHNAEKVMRWNWERTQAKLFRIKLKYLHLDQWQRSGASLINELKNILIAFVAATEVIDGDMTLGMMLAVLYIIGQLNAPVQQLLRFVQFAQDAKISLERMGEIHQVEEELRPENTLSILPQNGDLWVENVSFQYSGPHSPLVLKKLNLYIPEGKTTAIVGTSGSGKTTLVKLLLQYYRPVEGKVRLGDVNLQKIHPRIWRDCCSVVLQDSYIFSDSIAKNIALGAEIIDKERLLKAAHLANILPHIDSLPLGFNTKIGKDGVGLSQGQRQRLLIARAIYKDPDYLFFDEATNALDAYNEMVIMDNLHDFIEGKTVVIVAHRLSTVKNASNIVVLDKGEIIEQGTHEELTRLKGAYFHLVKNQLELGV